MSVRQESRRVPATAVAAAATIPDSFGWTAIMASTTWKGYRGSGGGTSYEYRHKHPDRPFPCHGRPFPNSAATKEAPASSGPSLLSAGVGGKRQRNGYDGTTRPRKETRAVPDVALAELPPILAVFSRRNTSAPEREASIDAASPASPPPTTTTGSLCSTRDTRDTRSERQAALAPEGRLKDHRRVV